MDAAKAEFLSEFLYQIAAGGNQLYIRLVMDYIECQNWPVEALENFPAGLEALWDFIWENIDPCKDFLAYRILGLLAVMKEYGSDEIFF